MYMLTETHRTARHSRSICGTNAVRSENVDDELFTRYSKAMQIIVDHFVRQMFAFFCTLYYILPSRIWYFPFYGSFVHLCYISPQSPVPIIVGGSRSGHISHMQHYIHTIVYIVHMQILYAFAIGMVFVGRHRGHVSLPSTTMD